MQYVQQDVAELLPDEAVDDEIDGRVECEESVRDGVSTTQDVDVGLSAVRGGPSACRRSVGLSAVRRPVGGPL